MQVVREEKSLRTIGGETSAKVSLWKLSQTSDCVMPIDNQSLYTIYEKISSIPNKVKKPYTSLLDNGETRKLFDVKKNEAFHTMNNIVANLLLNMTCSMRFEGDMNVDINDIVTNLVPFANLNFLTCSMTPFFAQQDMKHSTK